MILAAKATKNAPEHFKGLGTIEKVKKSGVTGENDFVPTSLHFSWKWS